MNPLMATSSSTGGHSATVDMLLHIDGRSLSVSQAGPVSFKLSDAEVLRPGPAALEVIVDGHSDTVPIMILENTGSHSIRYTRAG